MSIVPLREAADRSQYGGKAASLCNAIGAGLPVPEGLAVSFATAERIAAGQPDAAKQLLSALATIKLPVAVRSSAVAEDGAESSYAGIFKTVLNAADADQVLSAVQDVWSSASSGRTTAYSSDGNGDQPANRMAVLVQQMAAAEISGVLFTRHPVTGEDIRFVEAGWGLGESVAAGRIIPDQYSFRRGRSVGVHASLGSKETAIRPLPDGGTREEEIAAPGRQTYCLAAEHLLALDALASACERLYGPALDMEWAYSGGKLFLLQCRPITV
ncbi:hypothetical protein GZH47_19575 [Paenibacillus rhizovicinus]|uniref:Pyruvate phosphate dikinase AMP/ATP-binding domain-containing protein n=1 Tax=Paenibacillus rhizovicinus TaxID=2704463 RepID=A0A6C0P2T9_9BACL|nr:PEP/pyruvate-binding domain-containing protein [Paenibacillus rhizovicinus]QHW32789.1 hypothetical protein GZH47_19575 [Paenibacillus rhizovicinus]